MPEFYSYTVEFRIPSWKVAEGDTLDEERVNHMLQSEFSDAYPDELSARIVKRPKADLILREQGRL